MKNLFDFYKKFWYNIYRIKKERNGEIMNQYLSTESKEYQLMALQNRLQVIQEKGKATQGVIRKLKRQIRNLKCDILF